MKSDYLTFAIIYVGATLLLGVALSLKAKRLGARGWLIWFFACLIFSPMLTWIAFRLLMKRVTNPSPASHH